MSAAPSRTSASPLLDASSSMLRVQTLRSWTASARERLRQRMAALHREWAGEWLPAQDGSYEPEVFVSDSTAPAGTAEDEVPWSFACTSRHTISLLSGASAAQAAPLASLVTTLFGSEGTSPFSADASSERIADIIALAAWSDWLQRVGEALGGFALAHRGDLAVIDPGPALHAWSGVLQVQWTWCGGTWILVLPHDAVVAAIGPIEPAIPTSPNTPEPKENLDRALSGERLVLRVLLDGAELNLGQLQGLGIGDVVPLAHRLDAPARVVSPGGTSVCDGWLGRSEGRVAIELVRPRVSAAGLAPDASSSMEGKS